MFDLAALHMSLIYLPRPPSLFRVLELTVVSVGCFETSRYCIGMGGASKVFRGVGELGRLKGVYLLGCQNWTPNP